MNHKAYLAIEASLSGRLTKSWRAYAPKLLKKIYDLMKAGKKDQAVELVNGLDLAPLVEQNLASINYFSNAALLFGATRVYPKAALTEVARGNHGYVVNNAVTLLTASIVGTVEDSLRRMLLERIAMWGPETIHKFNQNHDKQGRFSTAEEAGVTRLEGSLEIKRKDMPQIAQAHVPEFIAFAKKRGIDITEEKVAVSTLKPAQNEYNAKHAAQLPPELLAKPIMVSKDSRVLDGTNRWKRLLDEDPHQKVAVRRIDRNAKAALKLMHAFPKSFSKDVALVGATRKYDADQPRAPAGTADGGQWVKTITGGNTFSNQDDWETAVIEEHQDKVRFTEYGGGKIDAEDSKTGMLVAHWDGYGGHVATRTSLGLKKAADSYIEPFVSFQSDASNAGDALLQMVSSLHTSRLSAFGFTVEADVRGLGSYTIDAQLDNRVCPVCDVLDGRTFPLEAAQALLRDAFGAQNPEDLKTIQPWPPQDKRSVEQLASMSDEELIAHGWHVPPFHPWCRCLIVPQGENSEISDTASAQAAREPDSSEEDVMALAGGGIAGLTMEEVNAARDTMDGLSGTQAAQEWQTLLAEGYTTEELQDIFDVQEADVMAGTVRFPVLT